MADYNEYNYGVGLLKFSAAFAVVCIHSHAGIIGMNMAVPIFVITSFYFGAKKFEYRSSEVLKNRVLRLLIPFWSWGCISILIYSILSRKMLPFEKVMAQFVFGHSVNEPLYFLSLLIVISILFWSIYRYCKKRFWIFVWIFVLCLIMQYSGVNFRIFKSLPYECRYTLGRFFEFLPSAILGLFVYEINCNGLKTKKILMTALLLVSFDIFARFCGYKAIGFGYHCIVWPALSAVIFQITLLVGRYFNPNKSGHLYRLVFETSFGIFLLHTLVQVVMRCLGLKFDGMTLAMITFSVSFFIVFLLGFTCVRVLIF